MDSEKMREEFYKAGHDRMDFWAVWQAAWKASRKSLVVEWPDPFWPGYVEEDEPGLCISTNLFTIEQITEALADQGITAS
jgi:hypothetical protein